MSIPHKQCTTTVFINCFLYLTPHFLKNQPFPPQKVRRPILYQNRYNPHVLLDLRADIFLISENRILRSTYFFVILGLFRFYGNFLKYMLHAKKSIIPWRIILSPI